MVPAAEGRACGWHGRWDMHRRKWDSVDTWHGPGAWHPGRSVALTQSRRQSQRGTESRHDMVTRAGLDYSWQGSGTTSHATDGTWAVHAICWSPPRLHDSTIFPGILVPVWLLACITCTRPRTWDCMLGYRNVNSLDMQNFPKSVTYIIYSDGGWAPKARIRSPTSDGKRVHVMFVCMYVFQGYLTI